MRAFAKRHATSPEVSAPTAPPSEWAIETMLDAYVTCALWSSNDWSDDNGGDPMDQNYGPGDLAPETLEAMRADCLAFATAHALAIACWPGTKQGRSRDPWYSAGFDLWLNRNGHGSGFWDGDWPEPAATELDKAAKVMGDVDLYIGDDGRIYQS